MGSLEENTTTSGGPKPDRRPRSRRRKLALLLGSLALSLGLSEVAVRVVLDPPGFIPAGEQVLLPHPTRDYVLAPGLRLERRTPDYTVEVRTNGRGERDDRPEGALARPLVLALGDSFTFGLGVERDEAWPAVLERELTREGTASAVLNCGVSGYSLAQIHASARELVPRNRPELVIVGLYPSRSWRLGNPYVLFAQTGVLIQRKQHEYARQVPGGVVVSSFRTPAIRRLDGFLSWCHLAGHGLRLAARLKLRLSPKRDPKTRDPSVELAPLLTELGRLHEYLRTEGVPLVVFLVNEQGPDGTIAPEEQAYNALVRGYCESRGLPCADPLDALEQHVGRGETVLRLGADHHWSPLAHRVAGEVLSPLVRRELERR